MSFMSRVRAFCADAPVRVETEIKKVYTEVKEEFVPVVKKVEAAVAPTVAVLETTPLAGTVEAVMAELAKAVSALHSVAQNNSELAAVKAKVIADAQEAKTYVEEQATRAAAAASSIANLLTSITANGKTDVSTVVTEIGNLVTAGQAVATAL